MPDLAFSCSCGALQGVIANASPRTGTHAACHCQSCRAGELYTGAPDPAPAPVAIFQTSPHRVQITKGAEHLAPFSFGPKNLLRWRATCCGQAMFNTPRNPAVSFVGIRTTCIKDPSSLGAIQCEAFVPTKDGKTRHKGIWKLAAGPLSRMIANRLSGRWKDTPFFDAETRQPVAAVTVVPKDERKALLQ